MKSRCSFESKIKQASVRASSFRVISRLSVRIKVMGISLTTFVEPTSMRAVPPPQRNNFRYPVERSSVRSTVSSAELHRPARTGL